jgi:hypothetical protein
MPIPELLSDLDFHQTTLQAFIAQLQPRAWNRPVKLTKDVREGETLDDWGLFNERWDLRRFFDWPPDVFLLTSLLLHRTGAYRAGSSPPKHEFWPEANWPKTCRTHALKWREWICGPPETRCSGNPHPLEDYIQRIESCYKIPVNDLHNVEIVLADRRGLNLPAEIWNLCKCLLELHAISDETMRGVGTLFAPHVSLYSHENVLYSHEHVVAPAGIERIHLQANLLLALRGTLSRIGKHRGIVLPKSRTPQSGVTLRSLSLHLSFHHTEVDVAWRAVPWTNVEENTLNLLLVPWPYHIRAEAFKPEMGPESAERLGNSAFFTYDPHCGDDGTGKPFDPEEIVALVLAAEREAKRVHFLVFPEAALNQADLDRLKDALEDSEIKPSHMPLVVAGLSGREDGDASSRENGVAFNRVVVSIFYAQRWFDMVQDKHHRWKLDAEQISSYSLGGTLSGARSWWEAIRIPRRRLSFLTSNSWLTLAPLICEDLARLEPISDVIRGVGPTLLIALLLDGPQLTTRWPSRYASVLADDPGTSVLTLTSLGMCQRSLPARVKTREEATRIRDENGNSVALWNDQFWRWHSIKIDPKDRAALLTVATQWIKEDTFDTRAEAENSAVFTFQSIHIPKLPKRDDGSANKSSTTATPAPSEPAPKLRLEARSGQPKLDNGSKAERRRDAALADVTELSLYTFFVDALIDTPPGREHELLKWMHSVIGLLEVEEVIGPEEGEVTNRELLVLLRWSLWRRKGNPAMMPTPHLFLALRVITKMVAAARRTMNPGIDPKNPESYWAAWWRSLVDAAEAAIQKSRDRMREDRASRSDGKEGTKNENQASRYSALLDVLEKRAERMATRAHNSEVAIKLGELLRIKRGSQDPLDLKRKASGRLLFSAPLAILWAVHNRLSIRRRTRTLLRDDAMLLNRIEELLESDEYSNEFRAWKKSLPDFETVPSPEAAGSVGVG